MASDEEHEHDHEKLVQQLTAGFGALVEQVQELVSKNQDLEQRLARVREEIYHIFRNDGPLSMLELEAGLNPKKKGYYGGLQDGQVSPPKSTAGIKSSDELGTGDKSSARAIAGAIQAWKILKDRQKTHVTEVNADLPNAPSIPPDKEKAHETPAHTVEEPRGNTEEESNDRTFPGLSSAAEESGGCPFAPGSNTVAADHSTVKQNGSGPQRPDSLPTPPALPHDPLQELAGHTKLDHSSPTPSATGSASKCPIRFLDQSSPEEIAEYFQNHRHEIPRSHEICVKRYQRNAESIRQLDAKYGNLVSMIRGLGEKHQPLLPSKFDGEAASDDEHASQKKIEQWAEAVRDVPKSQAIDGTGTNAEHNARVDKEANDESVARQGRFERPLKDIRLGESPSRPWGISVPVRANNNQTSASANEQPAKPRKSSSVAPAVGLGAEHANNEVGKEDGKRMVFTGPVFFGYSVEEAAGLVQQSNA